MLINYLIKNEDQVIAGMYNHDDGVIIFTVPNRDKTTVDKCDMNPHYVLCSVYKLNSVQYYFDDGGGGSILIQHWVSSPKILKEKNNKRGLIEAKNQKYFKNIYKVKYRT